MKIINNILSKVVLVILVSFAMFSCSGSGDYLPASEESNTSKANAYMTINLSGSTSSRTLGGSEAGINTDENKISSLAIALINTSNNTVSILTSPTLNANGSDVSVEPFLIPQGSYKIILVANPTDAVIAKLASAQNYASLQVTMDDISTYAASNSFMMTNAVNYSGDESNIPTVSVTAENTVGNAAHPANPIQLDRMAVKIRMKSDMATTFKVANFVIKKYDEATSAWSSTTDNQVVLKSYALLNTYQKANLYQSWNGNSTSEYNQLLITPNSSSDYAANDFQNDMDSYSTRTKDAGYTSGYSQLVDLTHDKSLTDLTAVSYCLENNSKATNQVSSDVNANVYYTKAQNTTTGVLFRAQASGKTFYSYNGKYYADLASIQAEYSNVFSGKSVSEVEQLDAPTIRTNYGVKVYEDGYMYYYHYIYDMNYSDPAAMSGSATNKRYYAVIRNSIYDMNVTGIKKFGDDIPGGWDYNGNDDIDKKEASMKVELTVSPWVLDFYSVIL